MVNNTPVSADHEAMRTARTLPMPAAAPSNGAAVSTGILPELLGYRLRRAQTAVFKRFAETVGAAEDITPGLFGMAEVIAANPGLSQSRLAEAMGVDRSTIVIVVDRLEARGLVVRAPSASDQRSHALRLTRRGRLALRRIERRVRSHEEEIARALDPAERAALMRLLARLYEGAGERARRPAARDPGRAEATCRRPSRS